MTIEQRALEFKVQGLVWLGWSVEGEPLAVLLEKGAIRFRELAAGKERRFEARDLPARLFEGYPCAYNPVAKVLAVRAEGGIVHVWDVSTGKEKCVVETKGRYVDSLALSHDGKTL